MSHVKAGLGIIKDIECLKRAVAKFPQLKFLEDHTTYAWNGEFYDDWGEQNEHLTARARGIDPSQYGQCDHAIRLPGCTYEIGVTKRKDGQGWSLVWDVWLGRPLSKVIGEDAEKLMTAYNLEYCQQFSQTEGFSCEISEVVEDVQEIVMTEY
jgi:hypothetical protein